jgi:hypothetical protein
VCHLDLFSAYSHFCHLVGLRILWPPATDAEDWKKRMGCCHLERRLQKRRHHRLDAALCDVDTAQREWRRLGKQTWRDVRSTGDFGQSDVADVHRRSGSLHPDDVSHHAESLKKAAREIKVVSSSNSSNQSSRATCQSGPRTFPPSSSTLYVQCHIWPSRAALVVLGTRG